MNNIIFDSYWVFNHLPISYNRKIAVGSGNHTGAGLIMLKQRKGLYNKPHTLDSMRSDYLCKYRTSGKNVLQNKN